VADFLTLTTIGCGLILFLVRIFRKAARDLSRLKDYLLLLVVLLPFVSGWFAVHPESAPLTYEALMLIHVLSAELVFVLMPTTKLAHVVLFPFDRLSGDIFWRLVPGAGDRVAETLRGSPQGAEV
jgi:nitrate reductase gamma subunit